MVKWSRSKLKMSNPVKSDLEADVLLVAIGRRPFTEGLNFEAIGLEKDNKGRLIIDDQFKTKHDHIRVIGDVTFGPMLAHLKKKVSLLLNTSRKVTVM